MRGWRLRRRMRLGRIRSEECGCEERVLRFRSASILHSSLLNGIDLV